MSDDAAKCGLRTVYVAKNGSVYFRKGKGSNSRFVRRRGLRAWLVRRFRLMV